MSGAPLRVAIAGLGGFAGQHHQALAALEAEGECKLVATCDPRFQEMSDGVERFDLHARGVRLYSSLDELLAGERGNLDMVCLPTPIPLHASQHAAALGEGLGCYLEKPPTLNWAEYLGMGEVNENARWLTQVGFNFISDPFRRDLKNRILAGEFGAVHGVSFCAVWPRDLAYYRRSPWAGKVRLDGQWVFDSCIGNAMAHYVQNVLFWCGTSALDATGRVGDLSARLYRAHPIESFDTAFVSAQTEQGPWLRIAATHVGNQRAFEREVIHLDHATIRFDSWRSATIHFLDGREERIESSFVDQGILLKENIRRYFAYLRGEESRPITRLEDCQGFVALHVLATIASRGVQALTPAIADENGRMESPGLEEKLSAFAENGIWPFGQDASEAVAESRLDVAEEALAQIYGA